VTLATFFFLAIVVRGQQYLAVTNRFEGHQQFHAPPWSSWIYGQLSMTVS